MPLGDNWHPLHAPEGDQERAWQEYCALPTTDLTEAGDTCAELIFKAGFRAGRALTATAGNWQNTQTYGTPRNPERLERPRTPGRANRKDDP
jgi:capsid protein